MFFQQAFKVIKEISESEHASHEVSFTFTLKEYSLIFLALYLTGKSGDGEHVAETLDKYGTNLKQFNEEFIGIAYTLRRQLEEAHRLYNR